MVHALPELMTIMYGIMQDAVPAALMCGYNRRTWAHSVYRECVFVSCLLCGPPGGIDRTGRCRNRGRSR